MARVGHIGESSHDHDRDDHGATEEGNVRMTVHERHAQESADPIGSTQTLGTMRLKGDVAEGDELNTRSGVTQIP